MTKRDVLNEAKELVEHMRNPKSDYSAYIQDAQVILTIDNDDETGKHDEAMVIVTWSIKLTEE